MINNLKHINSNMSSSSSSSSTNIKNNHVIIILDESGSMNVNQLEMIQTVNSFIKDQQQFIVKNEQCFFTLITFNNTSKIIMKDIPIKDVALFTTENYKPSGGTALYDAIGTAIALYTNEQEVVLVIVTDGEENSSRRFNQLMIKTLIEKYTLESRWNVIYLAANPMLKNQGTNIGINNNNNTTNMIVDFSTMERTTSIPLSRALSAFRSGETTSINIENNANDDTLPPIQFPPRFNGH